jgi:hypothetical protein
MALERAHSPIFWNNNDGSFLAFINLLMCEINVVSIETGRSIQIVPPWTQLRNTLT